MPYRKQTAIIGDVVEKESRGDRIFMAVESLGKRSDQPHLLARWRTSGELIDNGDMSTDEGDAVTQDACVGSISTIIDWRSDPFR